MNIFDKFTSVFKREPLDYQVTNQNTWSDYTYLLDQNNYLDQYFGWTYKASITRANSISFYEPELYEKTRTGEEIELENHPLLNDLYHFNNFQTLSEARRITQLHKDLAGIAFWHLVTSETKGHLFDFFILDPTRMSVKTDKYGLPTEYQYTTIDGGKKVIPVNDIIIFREPNPKNWLWGYSPLSAARLPHNTYELAAKYNMNMFGNMGRPDGFLVFEGISEDERKRIEQQLKQKYTGVNNAKKIGILNKMVNWIETAKSQEDLQYIQGMQMMRDEILSIFGVPKPLVGLTDSTYTNSIEAQRIYQQYTIYPELFKEAEIYNEQLLPKYYDGVKYDYSNLEFRFEDPIEADKAQVATYATTLYNSGVITLNEARELVDVDELPEGDTFKQPAPNPFLPIKEETEKPVKESETEYIEEKEFKKVQEQIKELSEKIEQNDVDDRLKEMEREELRKYFDIRFDRSMSKFLTSVQSYLVEQSKRVIGTVNEKKIKTKAQYGISMNLDQENKIAVNTLLTDLYAIALDSNYIANRLTGAENLINQETLDWIKKKLEYFSKEMNDTTLGKLEEILTDAEMNGWTLEQTKNSIKALFDKWAYGGEGITDTRAMTIASTETLGVSNKVAIDNYAENPYVIGLEWLAVGDMRTRHTHMEADGQVVSKKPNGTFEKFTVGGKSMFGPGDPAGGPAEICNCRCQALPVMEE